MAPKQTGRGVRALLQLLALALLPAIVALIWFTSERPPPSTVPMGGKAAGAGKVAAAGALNLPAKFSSGWALKGRLSSYDKKTLFDRINGGAPAYIRAGYVGSVGGEYGKEGFKDTVMVDVYDMGGAARALGMYATERDPSYSFVELGDEGYLASGSLNLWSGRYYLKLAGFEEGEAMDAGLKELAAALVKALPAAPDLAAVRAGLALLPARGRAQNGAGYAYTELGDVKGLQGVFTARYTEGAATLTLFALEEKDAAAARARMDAARKYFQEYEARVEVTEGEGGAWQMSVAGQGASHLLVRRGAVIGGALDLTEAAQQEAARSLLAGLGAPGKAAGEKEP